MSTTPGDGLGRHVEFDERSRQYPIRALIGEQVDRRKRLWDEGPVLDQGREGACVGFAWAGELAASPVRVRNVTDALALDLYHEAQRLDQWEGEAYEGTSVLAGAKAVQGRGWLPSYRWAFGVDDCLDTLIAHGPVVVGTWWMASMYSTRPSGLVEVTGERVGGHAYLLTGYHPRMRLGKSEGWFNRYEVVRFRNSWGPSYGRRNGSGYMLVEDLARLLADDGECCVPVTRAHGTV